MTIGRTIAIPLLLGAAILSAAAVGAVPVKEGLIIHLKADVLTLNDGDPVTAWPDSSTDDAVDGTVEAVTGFGKPVYVKSAYNGMPAVRFDGNVLSTAGPFALPAARQGMTVIALFSGDSTGQPSERLGQIGDASGSGGQVIGLDCSINCIDDDGGAGFRFNNGRALIKSDNPLTPGFHTAVWQIAQGDRHRNAFFSVDGVLRELSSNNPTNATTLPVEGNMFSLGCGMLNGGWIDGDLYSGYLAEILVYNAQLTAEQIRQIEGCLLDKYRNDALVTDGLIIHLKADALPLSDGEPVTVWPDAAVSDSVNGTVIGMAGFGVPMFKAEACNGMPAVRFTRPADPLSAPNVQKQALISEPWSWAASEGTTVFIVCTGGVPDAVQRVVQVGKAGGEAFKSFACDVSSGQNGEDASGSGVRYNNGWTCTAAAGANPVRRGQWHISVRQIAQGGSYGSIRYGVDEIPYVVTTSNQPDRPLSFDAADNDLTLGNGRLNGGWTSNDWYEGDVAEVLVYNKQLTPAQVSQVMRCLNARYRVTPSMDEKPFTIAAIPDTQGYPNHVNQPASITLFKEEMQFIVDHTQELNIVFASHEGDVVMTSNPTQYSRALSAMDRLKNTLPFGMVPGNHDYDTVNPSENSTLWNSHFGPDRDFFRDKSWYGGAYLNTSDTSGMTSWQTFTVGEINFLHLALELEPRDAVLNWAQKILDAHPGWPTIVTTHSFIKVANGTYTPATRRDPLPRNNAQQLWDQFIKTNSQIFMVLCGHSFDGDYYCSWRRDDVNDAGYPVHQLMADYQACHSGSNLGNGGGWLRLMEFNPATNTIRVRTYSTILNKYSSDPTLTNGSNYARNWAIFNYDNQGQGDLFPESHARASEFTIPFIYGRQLPKPAEVYGDHIRDLSTWFVIGVDMPSGLAFDPSFRVDGGYDRLYYLNRSSSGTQGLYQARISTQTSGVRLSLSAIDNPYGCTVAADGSAYVCYNADPAVWKVTDPADSPVARQMLGNYRFDGDDDIQSVMMVPAGFGGGFSPEADLILIDSGLDSEDNEAVVVLQSDSTPGAPRYSVLWQDDSAYFSYDIKGAVSPYDGYCYLVQAVIPTADLNGTVRPYINRINGDGTMQRIFLTTDITRGGASAWCDDAIAVNPANGSVWLATADRTAEGAMYPRTIWRIDMRNAVSLSGNDYLASATAEITNAYYNVGVNAMAWSPDGKYLAVACPDTDRLYVYTAAVPVDCADAIAKGYGFVYDFNQDCRVNITDFSEIRISDLLSFVDLWLNCNDPQLCDWLWQ